MRLSARNVLRGTISRIVHGVVNTEVTVDLPDGQQVVAVITKSAAEGLGLTEGRQVSAVIKASNVMIGVE